MTTDSQNNSITFNTGAFKFSGSKIDDLQSSEYTIAVIAVDTSMSISQSTGKLLKALKETMRSLQKSPRSDNLLLRVISFDYGTNEVHGFTELNKCDLSQYDRLFDNLGGKTSLFDASADALDSLNTYGKELVDQDYLTNAILVVITDGLDNASSFRPRNVGQKMKEGIGETKLESLLSILVGVNIQDPQVGIELDNFRREASFDQYVEVDNVTENSVAKLANFISKSVSSQSSSLGGGSKSQTIAF